MYPYVAIIEVAASYYAAKHPNRVLAGPRTPVLPTPVVPGVCVYCDSPRADSSKRCNGCGATKVKEPK